MLNKQISEDDAPGESGRRRELEVLVGIVTRNRAELLARSIESARRQTGCKIAISIIDDASTDHTPTLSHRWPEISWTRWDEGAGLIAARNRFMNQAGYKYFVSLDDDAWFMSRDEISIGLKYMEERPEIGAIAFDIITPAERAIRQRSEPRQVSEFVGCGHMLRLAVVQDLGGYIPTPGTYGGEEKDLSLRLLDAGYIVVLLSGAHVWHEITSLARDEHYRYGSVVCNDLAITFRRTPTYLLPLAIAAKLVQSGIQAMLNGRHFAYGMGVLKFFRSLRALWPSRKPVRMSTLLRFMRLSRAA